jgi:zinc protease
MPRARVPRVPAVLIALLPLAVAGQVQPAPLLAVSQFQLKNGLRVVLQQDHGAHVVAVDLLFRAGAANEAPGKSGYAHLLEHMWFQGSRHLSKKLMDTLVTDIGGKEDGTTVHDYTRYWASVPSNQLETILWARADQMGFMIDQLDSQRLDNQKEVVRNELRQNYENTPDGILELKLYGLLFPRPHPYHDAIIGVHDEIQAATLADVREFFIQNYDPSNASLVIAGDFEPQAARRWVEKYFGSLPSVAVSRKHGASEPTLDAIKAEHVETIRAEGTPERLLVGWAVPPPFTPDDAALRLLSVVLGDSRASLLYRKLVLERGLARDVQCWFQPSALGSVLSCHVHPTPGVSLDAVLPAFDAVLDELRTSGPTDAALAAAKSRNKAQIIRETETMKGRAKLLNLYFMEAGDADSIERDLGRYEAVTVVGAQRAADGWLKKSRRVVIKLSAAAPGAMR